MSFPVAPYIIVHMVMSRALIIDMFGFAKRTEGLINHTLKKYE
jgi:hypothetical protein